ncbi:hypothetical protein DFP72DRAFT_811246 [Ephemerocybe angulata]|uniref:Zinc finger PHD-type domain-containing protein n=1 Tax=Ephemerocybe angulata TaxID=980116 RepID=A0A8H6I1A2_9AGAR|nr:hypothetical protein DFP72DRAFT_811246 [Tulosesus angulatus]
MWFSLGRVCFLGDMGDKDLTDIASANTAECSQCTPAVKLDLSQGQRVLEHVGCHVLFDPLATESSPEPCGLCLRSPDRCKWFVAKGRGAKSNLRVDSERSVGCGRPVSYVYGVAATSSAASPCSNVPLRCPLCSKADPAVWRYNLHHHLVTAHPTSSPADFASLWKISDSEMAAMKKLWANRQPKAPKRARKSNAPKLVVSAAHTSQAIPGTTFASDTEDRPDELSDASSPPEDDNDLPSDFDSEGGAHVYIADAISTWNDEPFIETGFGSGGAPSVSTGLDLVDAVDVSRGSESRVEAAGQVGTEDGCSMMVDDGQVVRMDEPIDPTSTPIATVTTVPTETPIDVQPELGVGKRVRKRRLLGDEDGGALNVCICGSVPVPNSPGAVSCKQDGCETTWYHIACAIPPVKNSKTWKCEACRSTKEGGASKRSKRA